MLLSCSAGNVGVGEEGRRTDVQVSTVFLSVRVSYCWPLINASAMVSPGTRSTASNQYHVPGT